MDRKERLISYFNSDAYVPLKLKELKIVLDVPEEDADEFAHLISQLEQEGKITISKRGSIVPLKSSDNLITGVLNCNASGKFAFAVRENEDDIYISSSDFSNALHGDKVLVKIKGSFRGKPEGSVVKVVERAEHVVVGVVITTKGTQARIRPDDKRYLNDIFASCGDMFIKPGMRVAVEKIRVNPDGRVYGTVTASLGDKEDISSLLEAIIIENRIKTEFDSETISESEAVSEVISWDENEREDLRCKTIFTIDGELAKDFDDAISLEMTDDGLYRLGVHIADVSEYVKAGSALDREAYARGTSVYLPHRVIPMLPEKLSNGVCSLKPGVDRLTLSVFMDIDKSGKVVSNRIAKTVICSTERLVYEQINKLLEENDSYYIEKYSHILPELYKMKELAEILREKRFKRGAVDFDFPESEIITDADGNPVEVRYAQRGISNKMIEEFMLIANETVAEFAYWSEIPFVYRSHESPSEEKLSTFMQFLKPFGFSIKGKIDENNPVKPQAFKQILDAVKGTAVETIVSKTMLRSLMKADYRAVNAGHFGLAAKYYCHFTSPIRRYPDLMVHRSLKNLLDNKPELSMDKVTAAAKRSSDCEIKAETCERDCDDLLKTAFMSEYIGMDFEGVISGITSFGMFVEVGNSIEGLVRVENMTKDYYVYNEAEQTMTGERSGKKYTVGDSVFVLVAKTDILARKIDFVLSEDADRKLLMRFNEKDKRKRRRK